MTFVNCTDLARTGPGIDPNARTAVAVVWIVLNPPDPIRNNNGVIVYCEHTRRP